eukprot:CCRYP_005190-RB/>CCRYP_005190-RB protein AED:0.19 eAED:0.19 QI:179/1/1/1/1/1/2/412/179
MFSLASQVARRCAAPVARHQLTLCAGFAQSVKEGLTATDAWNKSCYSEIDYTISDDAAVYDAVQKFAAYNIGCLVTKDSEGKSSNPITQSIQLDSLCSSFSHLQHITLRCSQSTRKHLRSRQRARLRLQSRPSRQNLQRNESEGNLHKECQPYHRFARGVRLLLHGQNVDEGYSSPSPA